jgi:hypothetical protein
MHRKTVFVIGAGASKEANLPTGSELKEKISYLLDITFDFSRQISGDRLITDALRIHVQGPGGQRGDINPHLEQAWFIRDAMPLAISIDNFIDAHRDNEKVALCGKLAIVRSMLDAEKNSLLYFEKSRQDSNINFISLDEAWYLSFFQLLTENCQKDNLKERFESVTLIIFNYDRCIEHFMFHALRNYYRISQAEAADIVKCISIYHPYESVGSLPWFDSRDSMEFGAEPYGEQLLRLAGKIKTFTEGTDPNSSDILKIRSHMSVTERLVFMGFAFHELNMQLIVPDKHEDRKGIPPKCYATTYLISKSDEEVIRQQIDNLYGLAINTKMEHLTCNKFITEFRRSLAF